MSNLQLRISIAHSASRSFVRGAGENKQVKEQETTQKETSERSRLKKHEENGYMCARARTLLTVNTIICGPSATRI
jgi:hypothetical protein